MACPTGGLRIAVVGGSGHWAERHYYPALLALRGEIPLRVAAICDPVDPRGAPAEHYAEGREGLRAILAQDRPEWIAPSPFEDPAAGLERAHEIEPFDILLITSDPSSHFAWARWAVERGVHVLCEKPPFLAPKAASCPTAARAIAEDHREIVRLVERRRREDPGYLFYIPIKYRAMEAFQRIAAGLERVHGATGQGVTGGAVQVLNGLHRYPVEFLKEGAHGYREGLGALAHSSYHYLDLLAWFLRRAPGRAVEVGVSVPWVRRIGEYLRSGAWRTLHELLEDGPAAAAVAVEELPADILAAEFDFEIALGLYDEAGLVLGRITYASHHSSFSPRTAPFDAEILEPGNQADGGKMKQTRLDLWQGALQSFFLRRDHEHGEPKRMRLSRRLHPCLELSCGGARHEEVDHVGCPYRRGHGVRDLLRSFLRGVAGEAIPEEHERSLHDGLDDSLAHEIFATAYQVLAQDAAAPGAAGERRIAL